MVNRKASNIIIISMLFLSIIIYRLFLLKSILKYADIILASILLIVTAVAVLCLGFKKNKNTFIKKYILTITISCIISYFAITYIIGIFTGFLKNAYSLSLYSVIDNIFAPIALILCSEILRYVVISTNKDSKVMPVLVTIALIIIEISLQTPINLNLSNSEFFKLITLTIIPAIMKNSVLSYLTYHVGYVPALVYRLVVDVSTYIVPFAPDLGDYLKSITTIGLPFLMFIFSSRIINEYDNGREHEFKENAFKWYDIPIILLFVVLIGLVSGIFPVFMIGIGSGSMQPVLNKGDAVVIEKITEKTNIEEGQIIAYKKEGKTIVHRIIEVTECKDSEGECYQTKGDYNNTPDNIEIARDEILGIVKFAIPYIAYPAVYISEILE